MVITLLITAMNLKEAILRFLLFWEIKKFWDFFYIHKSKKEVMRNKELLLYIDVIGVMDKNNEN